MCEHEDRELVDRARQGDGAAIGALFSRYWRAARATAFGVIGEYAAAEDAAAEAFRQALAGLDSLNDASRFGPWLRTIVVRKARLELRTRRRMAGAPADEPTDAKDRPDEALGRLELEALARQAVRELPDRLREAVSLFYIEGYDTTAAAQFLDIPPGTFRRRLHEGRSRLRATAKAILDGRKSMNEERDREIERLKRVIDEAGHEDTEPLYQALRGALALRPAAHELIGPFIRRLTESASRPELAPGGKEFTELVRETARRFTGPSDRASDPSHPVGLVAAEIRRALPDFQDWPLDVGEAAARFLTSTGEHRLRLQSLLPPGFAEGRPGAFVRATRGLLRLKENGSAQSSYQVLQDSGDQRAFRTGLKDSRISDVLDLTWMVPGPIELRTVQEMLERLSAAVVPRSAVRFAHYDEPRYRSALALHVGGIPAPAAHGGVLAEWPGHPQGVAAAHVRIFLEPWATVRSGHVVEFDRLDGIPRTEP
jgi:RNA polymerase sigma-70 factor (ECF subfamily)